MQPPSNALRWSMQEDQQRFEKLYQERDRVLRKYVFQKQIWMFHAAWDLRESRNQVKSMSQISMIRLVNHRTKEWLGEWISQIRSPMSTELKFRQEVRRVMKFLLDCALEISEGWYQPRPCQNTITGTIASLHHSGAVHCSSGGTCATYRSSSNRPRRSSSYCCSKIAQCRWPLCGTSKRSGILSWPHERRWGALRIGHAYICIVWQEKNPLEANTGTSLLGSGMSGIILTLYEEVFLW